MSGSSGELRYHLDARRFIITGRVQGVGFRWFTMRHARSSRLDGWVRNCVDGSVEVWAEGAKGKLDALEKALKKGPPGAMIQDIHVESVVATRQCRGFDITY